MQLQAFQRLFIILWLAGKVEQRLYDSIYDALYVRCPATTVLTDLSNCRYADDVIKKIMVDCLNGARASSLSVRDELS